MSLLMDKDYLILSLRLAYLRKVDDHAGPRVISVPDIVNGHKASEQKSEKGKSTHFVSDVDTFGGSALGIQGLDDSTNTINEARQTQIDNSVLPAYATNSAVVLAGLNDARRHPELNALYSPQIAPSILHHDIDDTFDLSDISGPPIDEADTSEVGRARAISLGGSGGLKHTTTIYGPGRTGALGMRVSGRRGKSTEGKQKKVFRTGTETHTPASGDETGAEFAIVAGSSRGQMNTQPGERNAAGRARRSDMSDSASASEASDLQRNVQVPSLEVQASTYESDDGTNLSKRSASLRGARRTTEEKAPLSASIGAPFASMRGRSSSQPHRPVLPSGLSTVHTRDESATDEPGVQNQALYDRTFASPSSTSKSAAPPRPPRKDRKSISEHSTKSASAIPTSEASNTVFGSPTAVDGRQRSQSEAIMPGSLPPSDAFSRSQATSSADVSMSRSDVPTQPLYMGRTNSESTIFSLASPHVTRRRGLSNKSHQSDGSGPSVDLSFVGERLPGSTFAPVAEDPESMIAYGDPPGSSNRGPPSQKPAALNTVRDRAASDPRDSMPKSKRKGGPSDPAALEPVNFLTSAEFGKEELESPLPEPSSSENIGGPISHVLDVEQGSLNPSITPALSSIGTGVGVGQRGAKAEGKRALGRNNVSSFSPFVKADPLTVKKAFDSRSSKSALTSLISNRSEGPNNPFNQQYKSVAGSSVSSENSTAIEVFFPFAMASNPALGTKPRSGALALHPQSRSMQLSIRKDATMEELIGYSLYCYVEEDWRPRLDEGIPSDDSGEAQRSIRLSTLAWTLRLIEDGEVDDDYPALDRSLTVGKFGADELAVCEATPAQIKQNQAASAVLDKRVSRQRQFSSVANTSYRPLQFGRQAATPASTRGGSKVANNGPTASFAALQQGTPLFSSSVLSSRTGAEGITSGVGGQGGLDGSGRTTQGGEASRSGSTSAFGSGRLMLTSGAPIFLRILVTPNSDVRYKTTLQVTSDRYLADVLETICKRRELGNAEKWAFVVPDKDIVVPLDRTVESLQGNYDLALVRRQELGVQQTGALTMQSTNPNASIFKHASRQDPSPFGGSTKDVASVYKSYTVNRRMPTFLARHERILTIDGDWLHIIPTDTRAFQTQTATTSYPISSIVSCTPSRLPSSFKLIVTRENDQKRYDFEAESSKVATEIVQLINGLMVKRR